MQQRFAFGRVRLGRFHGFDKRLDRFRLGPLQLQQLRALLRVDHGGGDQFGHQMRRSAQPVEILEQVLNGGDGEISDHRAQDFDGASGILGQRVGHAGAARKFGGAIGEHFRSGAGPCQRGKHRLQRLRQQNARSLLPDRGIGIGGENAERLDAIFRREAKPPRCRWPACGPAVAPPKRISSTQRRANFRLLRLPSERPA